MKLPLPARLFFTAVKNFLADDVPRMGASLSYYTLFAVSPMLIIVIAVASAVFREELVRGEIIGQLESLIGPQGATTVEGLLQSARRDQHGVIATIIGSITFLLASTGAFLELQAGLNKIWRVKAKPGLNLKGFIINRAQSFALVIGLGFLLLVSLVISAALAALSRWMEGRAGGGTALLWSILNTTVSLVVIAVLFAAVFKVLPDVKLRWRDVAMGALATAVLFSIGKLLIGLYLGRSAVASTYGAAGSVVVLLLWVYYSSQMVFFGAELTRLHVEHLHSKRPPAEPFARKTSERKTKVA